MNVIPIEQYRYNCDNIGAHDHVVLGMFGLRGRGKSKRSVIGMSLWRHVGLNSIQ